MKLGITEGLLFVNNNCLASERRKQEEGGRGAYPLYTQAVEKKRFIHTLCHCRLITELTRCYSLVAQLMEGISRRQTDKKDAVQINVQRVE